VPGKLVSEIKLSAPIEHLEVEAFLNIQRTAAEQMAQLSELLKPRGLSAVQYNVLRILRGAGEAGLPSGEIGERMITREPDITRLMDRLEKRGYVTRSRMDGDRRVVRVKVTQEALDLLAQVDEPLVDLHRHQFRALATEQINSLIALLETVR
jgi:DNA-binding MarR family transcriptional regulator